MIYRELLTKLKTLTPAQLDKQVLYQDTNDGEFYGLRGLNPGTDYDEPEDQFFLDIEQ